MENPSQTSRRPRSTFPRESYELAALTADPSSTCTARQHWILADRPHIQIACCTRWQNRAPNRRRTPGSSRRGSTLRTRFSGPIIDLSLARSTLALGYRMKRSARPNWRLLGPSSTNSTRNGLRRSRWTIRSWSLGMSGKFHGLQKNLHMLMVDMVFRRSRLSP
jgi:hypothetical protein